MFLFLAAFFVPLCLCVFVLLITLTIAMKRSMGIPVNARMA